MLDRLPVTFDRILVPTDFSETSQCALDYAKSIARRSSARLLLVHVNPPLTVTNPPDLLNPVDVVWVEPVAVLHAVEQRLQHCADELRAEGFRAEWLSLTGSVEDEILFLSQREKIDLIVLGTHSRSGFERLMFGSDAESVLRHVGCPVITVGPEVQKTPAASWPPASILCATALHPHSAATAAFAHSLASQFGSRFTLLTVEWDVDTNQEAQREAFELALRRQLSASIGSEAPLQTLLSQRKPAGEIAGYARQHGVDLIVMGAHAASAFAIHLMHGTAAHVFAQAPCPVMTLREA